jgi:hypothetical protein
MPRRGKLMEQPVKARSRVRFTLVLEPDIADDVEHTRERLKSEGTDLSRNGVVNRILHTFFRGQPRKGVRRARAS